MTASSPGADAHSFPHVLPIGLPQNLVDYAPHCRPHNQSIPMLCRHTSGFSGCLLYLDALAQYGFEVAPTAGLEDTSANVGGPIGIHQQQPR